MKKRRYAFAFLFAAMLLSSCGSKKDDRILQLSFDEGSGIIVKDASGHMEDAELNYLYTNAAFTDSMDPQWRDCGIQNGCLLFDGDSTFVSYDKDKISPGGDELSFLPPNQQKSKGAPG